MKIKMKIKILIFFITTNTTVYCRVNNDLNDQFQSEMSTALNSIIAEPLNKACEFTSEYIKFLKESATGKNKNILQDQISFMEHVSTSILHNNNNEPSNVERLLQNWTESSLYNIKGLTTIIPHPYTAVFEKQQKKYLISEDGKTIIESAFDTPESAKFSGIRCYEASDTSLKNPMLCDRKQKKVTQFNGCRKCGDRPFDAARLCPSGDYYMINEKTERCNPKSYIKTSTQMAGYYIYQTINGKDSPINGTFWQIKSFFTPLTTGSRGILSANINGTIDAFALDGSRMKFDNKVLSLAPNCMKYIQKNEYVYIYTYIHICMPMY